MLCIIIEKALRTIAMRKMTQGASKGVETESKLAIHLYGICLYEYVLPATSEYEIMKRNAPYRQGLALHAPLASAPAQVPTLLSGIIYRNPVHAAVA